MAKYRNVFKEAAKRYNDFKDRGFIPPGSKYAYQDFVNEVVAENRGEYYAGAYTANAYERAYGEEVGYYESDSYSKVLDDYKKKLIEKYKENLLEIFDKNDFLDLAEKYGNRLGFYPTNIFSVSSLEEILNLARKALGVEGFVFRNRNGRNRREESGMIETYQNDFKEELNFFIDEIQESIRFN